MSNNKSSLVDLFKTPKKINKPTYNTLNNKLKAKKKLDDETLDLVIILYCFILLFALYFFLSVLYTDDLNKYKLNTQPQPYSLWDSIKLKLFGIPKKSNHIPNCYIKHTTNTPNITSCCITSEGKNCQEINEEWNKSVRGNNSTLSNNDNECCPNEHPMVPDEHYMS